MKRVSVFAMMCLLTMIATAWSQEVVITDFPVGVGGRVNKSFFKPYNAQLRVIADTMKNDFHAIAVITGSADGITYHSDHDAKNPGLALGRAHALRNYLITEFGVDSLHMAIQSEDASKVGGQYRAVSIRLLRNWFGPAKSAEPQPVVAPAPIPERVAATPSAVETFVPVLIKQMGLQFGAGVTSSPFGAIPFAAGAITWRRIIFVEASLGYTFWDDEYMFRTTKMDTRRRISGARLIVYPFESVPVGVVGGWSRIEEISQDYYQYVRMSEGAEFGVRATPLSFASVTLIYNPSMRRTVGLSKAEAKNGQFQISAMLHKTFGGDR